jgi:threonine/homoserine/homoserine lactone efflux protein
MTLSRYLIFTLTYFIAVITPGPGLAAIIARALGRGLHGMPAFLAGFIAGDLTLFIIAAAGLAVVAEAYAPILTAIRWGGAAYLLYLAFKLWTTPVDASLEAVSNTQSESPLALFLSTYSLTVSNPKPILFFVALLPALLDLSTLTLLDYAILTVTIAVIISSSLLVYAGAASRARLLFTSPHARTIINRITGTMLAVVAVVMAWL